MSESLFRGDAIPHDWTPPPAPPWRRFHGVPDGGPTFDADWGQRYPNDLERALTHRSHPREVELVNVAIMLRRPLLITGRPGTGKSTLAYAIAHELGLGPVLRWAVTSRTTFQEGLYRYDAIARLQDANLPEEDRPTGGIGRYLQLGPLGTALLPTERPRVLLIDEIDKSDVDLPNDLLSVFEEGEFPIPELLRISDRVEDVTVSVDRAEVKVRIERGQVRTKAFPVVVMTSNGERDFPPAFLRRCVRLEIVEPDPLLLEAIVRAHLGDEAYAASTDIVNRFLHRRSTGELATDQLLNAIFVSMHRDATNATDRRELADLIIRHLSVTG